MNNIIEKFNPKKNHFLEKSKKVIKRKKYYKKNILKKFL